MKRIFLSLLYAAATLIPLAALAVSTPRQNQPFALTLVARKQPLKSGKPLILHAIIANTSHRPLSIPISQGSADVGKIYQVHVLDELGRPAPGWPPPPQPKPGSRGKFAIRAGSIHGTGLGPGESLTDLVNVTYLYDLSRPGKYKVWIAEPFYRGPHLPNGLVRSNTITVICVK